MDPHTITRFGITILEVEFSAKLALFKQTEPTQDLMVATFFHNF